MDKKIFISYRRADSQHAVDRIVASLDKRIPRKNIFLDIDNIPPGVDFADYLDQKVAECDVLLAVMGPFWLNIDNGHATQILEPGQKHFERRLDDPDDFVRVEIASALKRGIPVVPVLLDGASMPSRAELPDDLHGFERRNAVDIRRTSFEHDVEKLVKGLGLSKSGSPFMVALTALLIMGGLGAAGFLYLNSGLMLPGQNEKTLSKSDVEDLWNLGVDAYTDRNYSQARRDWTKACEYGHTAACGDLGVMYQHGQGIEADPVRAVELYRRACDASEAQHCVNLGAAYGEGEGEGVTKDLVRARDYYDKACQLGNSTGCAGFGYYLARGWGGEVDKMRGWALIEDACDVGDRFACDIVNRTQKSGMDGYAVETADEPADLMGDEG